MDNSGGINRNLLIGVGGLLLVLVVLGVTVLARSQGAGGQAASPGELVLPGSTPGRASGYKGAELMPAVPGTAAANAGAVPVGHASGYKNSQLMPAVPGSGAPAAAGGGTPGQPAAPAHASGYQNSNLMPAPGAAPGR